MRKASSRNITAILTDKNSDVMEENVTKSQDDTSCLTKQHVFFFLSFSMFCEFALSLSMVL